MDDPNKDRPTDAESPSYQARRGAASSRRTPPGGAVPSRRVPADDHVPPEAPPASNPALGADPAPIPDPTDVDPLAEPIPTLTPDSDPVGHGTPVPPEVSIEPRVLTNPFPVGEFPGGPSEAPLPEPDAAPVEPLTAPPLNPEPGVFADSQPVAFGDATNDTIIQDDTNDEAIMAGDPVTTDSAGEGDQADDTGARETDATPPESSPFEPAATGPIEVEPMDVAAVGTGGADLAPPDATYGATDTAAAPIAPRDNLPGDAAPIPTAPVVAGAAGLAGAAALAATARRTPPADSVSSTDEVPLAPAGTVAPKTVLTEPEPEHPLSGEPARAGGPRARSFGTLALLWVLLWTALLALVLRHPFDRHMDWDTAYYATAARNLLRDGFDKLQGGIYLTAGQGFAKEQREFYAGHPPLTAWALAGWMKLWDGYASTHFAIRSLPLVISALNLLLLFAFVRRTFGSGAALAVTVFYSIFPMIAFYAQNVNMEPFVTLFILLACHGYLGWSRSGSKAGLLLLFLAVILGCWTDWPMYVFAGFLGAAHLFARRRLPELDAEGRPVMVGPPRPVPAATAPVTPVGAAPVETAVEEEAGPPLPSRAWWSSALLVLVPMLVFVAFVLYLKQNGSSFEDLKSRADERMVAATAADATPTRWGGYARLLGQVRSPHNLNEWLLKLIPVPAVLLAVAGVIFWGRWSRRLARADDERGRRAFFRLLACVFLMQLTYTLAFPEGAVRHDFWQYYLALPVAVMAGGFCTWLTVAGGPRRGFFPGLADRAAWAIAAAIPVFVVTPLAYRLHIPLPGRPIVNEGTGLHMEWVEPLRQHTTPNDVILTDLTQEELKTQISWYADRNILHDGAFGLSTVKQDELDKLVQKFSGRRILYIWGEVTEQDRKDQVFINLQKQGRYLLPGPETPATKPTTLSTTAPAGTTTKPSARPLEVYLLQGEAGPGWKKLPPVPTK